YNLAAQYCPTPFSRPHRFSLSYQYAIPFPIKNGLANKILGGWSLNGLTTIQAGNPTTFFDNNGGGVYGLSGSSIEKGFVTAQMASGATYDSAYVSGSPKDKLNNFFNIKAFNLSGPPILGDDGSRGYGNSGLGILRGPHQLNF